MQLSLFDYTQLDNSTREFVQERTERIHTLVKRSAQDIIDIGGMLSEIKEQLDYGLFEKWLAEEFAWTDRTARHFMNVHKKFRTENFSDLHIAPSALYLLASTATPDKAVEEALERAEQGEAVTHKVAKGIVERHRPPPPGNDGYLAADKIAYPSPPSLDDITSIEHRVDNTQSLEEQSRILNEFWGEDDEDAEFDEDGDVLADAEWNSVPEVAEMLKNMRRVTKILIPQLIKAIDMEKTSPEARRFIHLELAKWLDQLAEIAKHEEDSSNDR